jgi:hypothetical protein
MAAMIASRRTQPYRKGQPRHAGLAMKAMQKGRTGTGFNPADITRGIQKGGNAPRAMAQPVAPTKGVAKPKLATGLSARVNRSGNARTGQTFREVKGTSKSGVSGTYHVYPGGKRVFVADEGAKPRQARARSFAKRARGAGVG